MQFVHGETELIRQVARIGVPGKWIRSETHLTYETSGFIPVAVKVGIVSNDSTINTIIQNSSSTTTDDSTTPTTLSSSSSSTSTPTLSTSSTTVSNSPSNSSSSSSHQPSYIRFHISQQKIEFEGEEPLKEKFFRASHAYDDPLSNLDRVELPDRIIENLYLGAHHSALNLDGLRDRKITHILTIARGLRMAYPGEFKYKYIDILDWEQEDIYQYFESCMEFIEEARRGGGAILIHCAAGVSRSSTITIAYLMMTCEMTYEEARKWVSVRRWIYPNTGFVRHLLRWETTLRDRKQLKIQQKLEEDSTKTQKDELSSLM